MNLGELRKLTRERLDDLERPYLWSDVFIDDALNTAVVEACERAWLLVDRDNPSVAQMSYAASTNGFRLHSAVIDVQAVFFGAARTPVYRTSVADLQRRYGESWYLDTGLQPTEFYVRGPDLYLHPTPTEAGLLTMWVYRRPFDAETMVNVEDEPPIPVQTHRHLVHWACYEAFMKPDPDTRDAKSAAFHEDKFARHFGPRPSARLGRMRAEIGHRTVLPRAFGG